MRTGACLALLALPCAAFAGAQAMSHDMPMTHCGAQPQALSDFPATIAAADHPRALTATERGAISAEMQAHGWPSVRVLGRDRIDALVHVIQIQPPDAPFDETITNAMMPCAGVELDRWVFADLNDRLEMALGRPQQFATQYQMRGNQLVLRQPVATANVLILRGMLALPPVAEQTARVAARLRAGASLEQARGLPQRPTLPPLSHPGVRRQLLAWLEEDQALRDAWTRNGAGKPDTPQAHAVAQADRKHTHALRRLWADRNVTDASAIGLDGVHAAFMLIQHAPDIEWRRQQQPRLHELMEHGDLSRSDYAMYQDRILVEQGQPQEYGTQLPTVFADGHQESHPIRDPAHVDERRAQMNLILLAQYLQLNRPPPVSHSTTAPVPPPR